jgi:DNA repair protein RecO (recombination protein O)
MLASFLISTIQYLDAMEEASPDFHIVFMFQLSKHLGFYPQNNFGEGRNFFNLASGRFRTGLGDPGIYLDKESSDLWNRYLNSDLQTVKTGNFNGFQRKLILDNLVRFYKLHVAGLGEIRSLEVLHAYFHK